MAEQYATESISAGGIIPSVHLQKSAKQREGERWIPYGDFAARDGSSYTVSIFYPQHCPFHTASLRLHFCSVILTASRQLRSCQEKTTRTFIQTDVLDHGQALANVD